MTNTNDLADKVMGKFEIFIPQIPKILHNYLKLISPLEFDDGCFFYYVKEGQLVNKNDLIATYGCVKITAPFNGIISWLGNANPGLYEWNEESDGHWKKDQNYNIDIWESKSEMVSCTEGKIKEDFYMYSIIPLKETQGNGNYPQNLEFNQVFSVSSWPNGFSGYNSKFKKNKYTNFYNLIDGTAWGFLRKGKKLPESILHNMTYKKEFWRLLGLLEKRLVPYYTAR